MNFLTLIFSLLMIFAYTTIAILDKQVGAQRLRSTFLGHTQAHRAILRDWEWDHFKSLNGKLTETPAPAPRSSNDKKESRAPTVPLYNPACARLNLWPLVNEGADKHPLLYETAAKLLKLFYGTPLFKNRPQFEFHFLQAFIQAIKEHPGSPLEKLQFRDPDLASLYYRMLKGTKDRNLLEKIGYPSIIDAVCLDQFSPKVCVSHAHPDQLAVFVGLPAAHILFTTLHQEKGPPVTPEVIQKACSDAHAPQMNPELLDLLVLGRPHHNSQQELPFVASDEGGIITLRQTIHVERH